MSSSSGSLGGKKDSLLEFLAKNGTVSLNMIVGKVYEERESAKKALKEFEEMGWVEVTYGRFSITDRGQSRYSRLKESGISGSGSDRRLDTF